jgi:ribosomal protein S18 acetylase RimI-like enzyme
LTLPDGLATICAVEREGDGLTIRRAELRDLDALVALENVAFAADRVRISRRQWSYLVRRPSGATLVAEERGEIQAALVLTHRDGGATLRVYSLAVEPAARGRGLGRRLLEETDRYAQGLNLERVHLEVSVDNAPALSLYAACGYRVVSRLSHYYGLGEDGWRMEKVLLADFESDESAAAGKKTADATV